MGKRHSPVQIVRNLRQAEARLAAGATVPQAARELGTSEKLPSIGGETNEEAGHAPKPRLELRLRYGRNRGPQKAEDDAGG
jgi:hypothetical protein